MSAVQQIVIANQSSGNKQQVVCGGGAPLMLIAGPCQIESLDHALYCAERLKTMAAQVGMGFVYKSSYDKANRTARIFPSDPRSPNPPGTKMPLT